MNETVKVIIVVSLIFLIYFSIFFIFQEVKNNKCKDLGYTGSRDRECYKNLDYNTAIGEYNKCYMPSKENKTAEEWCINES